MDIPKLDIRAWSQSTHANNAARQVYLLHKATLPQQRWAMQPLADFEDLIEQELQKNPSLWQKVFNHLPRKTLQRSKLFEWCFEAKLPSEALQLIPPELQKRFQQLRQQGASVKVENRKRKQQIHLDFLSYIPYIKSRIYPFLVNVLALRPDPLRVEDPHPANVRVVGSVSQNYSGLGPHGMTHKHDLTLSSKAWVKALDETQQLDDAISEYERSALIPADTDPTIQDMGLYIVSPVSTKRTNPTHWRKSDNSNPYVRRIAVFIDDNEYNMVSQTAGIQTRFQQYPWWSRPSSFPANASAYRVDDVIIVRPPSKEETQQGWTIRHKLEKAFYDMQQFVYRQRTLGYQQGLDPRQLKFEAYMSWQVHGFSSLPKKLAVLETPDNPVPERFEEGRMDFHALFSPGAPNIETHPDTIHEHEIKQWERRYLSEFNYVVAQSGACCSGGLTA